MPSKGGNEDKNASFDLKQELASYLAKREEVGADEAAKGDVGKVLGGNKGNKVLEFVSAPTKEIVVEEAPNIFDYTELEKYGYSYLASPIMEAGGRTEMYKLMGLPMPASPKRFRPKPQRKVVIDRTGDTDQGRYQGFRGGLLDDDAIAKALEAGASAKKKQIREADYDLPFSDKRNVSRQQPRPFWTAEKLDKEGKKAGRRLDWAAQAKAGAFVKDPNESMVIAGGGLRAYSIAMVLLVAVAFGKCTTVVADDWHFISMDLVETLRAPALALVAANVGASVYCFSQAPAKNRNKIVWGVKGLLGGPLAISQLAACEALLTRAETDYLLMMEDME